MTPRSDSFLFLSATIANLLAFISGLAYSWSSPVLPKLKEINPDNPLSHPITPSEESWIVGLLSLGAIFGPVFSGFTADKIGRKPTLIFQSLLILLSLLTLALAKTTSIFYIARLAMGFGVGSTYMILPMYLIEIAQDHNRGTIGCLMGVFITLGLLFSYAVGPFLTIQNFCFICTIPLFIFIPCFAIWNPESPLFLATTNNQKQLKISLLKIRNKPIGEIEKEMFAINMMVQRLNQEKGGFEKLFSSDSLRKALRISVGLILFQQFSGVNAVLGYMQTIFAETGSGLSPEIPSIVIGVIQVCTTVLTSCLVDKCGRRILLLTSATGSSLSLIFLGIYFFLLDRLFQVNSISWFPVLSLISFIVFFNLGLASVPWTVMAELFPLNVKSFALTSTTVFCFIAAFIITFSFPSLALFLGMGQSFWLFAIILAIGACFIYWKVPETKGRSLQEIQSLLGNN